MPGLIKSVKQLKAERQTLELKSTAGGFPKIFDSISSFSNQDVGDGDHHMRFTVMKRLGSKFGKILERYQMRRSGCLIKVNYNRI